MQDFNKCGFRYRKHYTMKKILFCTLIGLVAALSLTSCLESDSNTQITEEDRASVIASFAGSFSGNLYSAYTPTYYYNDEPMTRDTTSVTLSFSTDQTYSISNFPLNLLAEALPENETDLKAALQTNQYAEVTGTFDVGRVNPDILMLFNMQFSFMMDGASHEVVIYLLSYYSLSQFTTIENSSSEVLYVQLYPQYLYLDGKMVCEFYENTGSYYITVPLTYTFISSY